MSKGKPIKISMTTENTSVTETGEFILGALVNTENGQTMMMDGGRITREDLVSTWLDITDKVIAHLGPKDSKKLPVILFDYVQHPEKYQ